MTVSAHLQAESNTEASHHIFLVVKRPKTTQVAALTPEGNMDRGAPLVTPELPRQHSVSNVPRFCK